MFNTDEEHGSMGSRDLITSLAREADAVFSFEPTSAAQENPDARTSGVAYATSDVKRPAPRTTAQAPELGE